MAETAIDRINAVLQAAYESEDDRQKAVAAARAAEFSGSIGARTINRGRYTLAILRASINAGVVDVFARAYRDGVQLGFGPDGTVDVERFVIVNPPVLVPDPAGDIVRMQRDWSTGEMVEARYRVDVAEALLSVLADMVRRSAKNGKNIVPGKEGRTTYTLFAATTDAWVRSESTTSYATAAATGSLTVDTTDTALVVGQYYSAPDYQIYESLVQWTTSSVAGTISSVVLSLYGQVNAGTTDTVEARRFDWGTGATTADWVPQANLASNTLLASFVCSGMSTSGYNDFTSDAAFISNINQSGSTRILLNSLRHRSLTTPTAVEYNIFSSANNSGTTQDPKLVIDATVTSAAYIIGGRIVNAGPAGRGLVH